MECTHDIVEREIAVTSDGMCPLCMRKRIEELEERLKRHDRSKYEMVNKQYLKQIEELAMNNNPKQYLKKVDKIATMVKKLRADIESERSKHSTDTSS
jgi:predicted DsbA family dithiol-disulfide isomerase